MKTAKKVIMTVLAIAITLTSLTINPVKAEAETGIQFDKNEYVVSKGYTVNPEVRINGEKWDIFNASEVTYSKKGIVEDGLDGITGLKTGSTIVTVKYELGEDIVATGSFKVKVISKKPRIKVEKTNIALGIKESTTIGNVKCIGSDYDGWYYKSSNKKVATVNKSGVIVGKAAGTANITVKGYVNGNKSAYALTKTIKVTVTQPDSVGTKYSAKGKKKITLRENEVTLLSKKSLDLKSWLAETSDPDYYKNDVVYKTWLYSSSKYGKSQIRIKSMSGLKNRAVTYKSSNKSVATVDAYGRVTPKNAGIATITVTSKENKKVSAKYTVKVVDGTGFFPATAVTKIGLEYGFETILMTDNNLVLTSSDESVIHVIHGNDCWNITPVSCGTVTLTAKSLDGFTEYSWKCTVTEGTDFSVASWR